jgi:hypothetical protein
MQFARSYLEARPLDGNSYSLKLRVIFALGQNIRPSDLQKAYQNIRNKNIKYHKHEIKQTGRN